MASACSIYSHGAGIWLVLGLISGLSQAATGDPAQSLEHDSSVSSMVTNSSVHSDMIVLTVDKLALRADLHTWPEEPEKAHKLQTFKIAIGKADGDKEREGDNRTPEGIYFAQSHIDGNELPDKYGTKAIPLNFPNTIDQVQGKTGHGIWLHGVDNHQRIEEAKVTEGCVAFYNPDITKLASWLKSNQGVIVIAADTQKVNRLEDIQSVRQRTKDWMEAWKNRRIDEYISYYAKDFVYQRFDHASYRKYKERVFKSYKEMQVDFTQLRVISHPKYAVALFNQDFQGDERYRAIGRKILYWERDEQNVWHIKREVYENRRFERLTFTDSELVSLSEQTSSVGLPTEKEASNPSL